MIARVERIQPQRIDRARRPQPQRVDVPSPPADDRRVVGHRLDRLGWLPDRARDAARSDYAFDTAAEPDVIDDLGSLELPRVAERKPLLRIFVLPAIPDDLTKESVIVADAVATGRNPEARHALHEARCEAAEAAVAERGVRFSGAQPIEIDAEIAKRGIDELGHPQVAHDVREQPADQEFE